jgi:hypothetical protein
MSDAQRLIVETARYRTTLGNYARAYAYSNPDYHPTDWSEIAHMKRVAEYIKEKTK